MKIWTRLGIGNFLEIPQWLAVLSTNMPFLENEQVLGIRILGIRKIPTDSKTRHTTFTGSIGLETTEVRCSPVEMPPLDSM